MQKEISSKADNSHIKQIQSILSSKIDSSLFSSLKNSFERFSKTKNSTFARIESQIEFVCKELEKISLKFTSMSHLVGTKVDQEDFINLQKQIIPLSNFDSKQLQNSVNDQLVYLKSIKIINKVKFNNKLNRLILIYV